MNPLPKTNRTEHKSKIVFEITAFAKALLRIESRYSDSFFSFEKTINPKPETSKKRTNSSAKFVLNVTNILVSRNEENTAKTGIVNLKSNHR